MIIDLNELNYKDEIDINLSVSKDERLDKRVIDLKSANVVGKIYSSDYNTYINLSFKGIMIIEDSITLEPLEYPFNIEIDNNLEEIKENYPSCFDNLKNTLDILEFLWENIVLEVPTRYTQNEDAKMSGNGWELGKNENNTGIDPRLEKLKELLKGDD
jgi:uncharacterized metal-binding protein YceD (DUF177 family)